MFILKFNGVILSPEYLTPQCVTLVSRHSFEVGRKRAKLVCYCVEMVEKLRENVYENGMKDNSMLE